ncbi:MAG: MATE family efflux transporter [Candidatus Hydrogenedentes bacterium]|jgi:putative MATE family efflux protein|nr:MATE family efflux transporter [Candidatus Hydrogenedentota bacterium]
MKEFDKELVTGSIFRSVWKLAWPVILLQSIMGVHGFVDHILVGNYVEDYAANAAIGISWQLFLVLMVFIAMFFNGMGILVARYSGRQEKKTVNQIAYQVFLASSYIVLFIAAPLGYLLTPHLIDIIGASPEIREYAQPYLRVLFTCSLPLFMTFALNSAFQATGDPRTPLKLGILTTLLNVALSYVLITGLGPIPAFGALGAAIGTVVAPLPSLAVAISLVMRHKMIVGPPERLTLALDFSVIKSVAKLGIPTGIQAVLLNVGGVLLLRFIGSLENSTAALAAYTICYTQLFSFVTWASFGLRASSATIMGQNLGAGQPVRARRGVYVTTFMAMLWAGAWAAVYWTAPEFLMGLFNYPEGDVFLIGKELLHFLSGSAFFVSAALAFTGGLQGAGDVKTPMYVAFLSQIVVVLGTCFVLDRMDRLTASWIWTAILMGHSTRFLATAAVFERGKWIHIKMDLEG